jgi:hypothetical protein
VVVWGSTANFGRSNGRQAIAAASCVAEAGDYLAPRLIGPVGFALHCALMSLLERLGRAMPPIAAKKFPAPRCRSGSRGAAGTFAFHHHPLVGCFAHAAFGETG